MLKVVVAVRRRTGLSFAEFRTRWCDEHPGYVQRMPGVRRYTQNLPLAGDRRERPFDGVAELWFDNKETVRVAFASAEGEAARDHEKLFDEAQWFLAEELTW